jgi:hypothetical protein
MFFREFLIEIFRYDQIENGITQKFKAFVGCDAAFFCRIDIRTVFQCLNQEVGIGECVLKFGLELFQWACSIAY